MLRRAGTLCFVFFFFNDTATTEIYTLSLHDALPISLGTNPSGGTLLSTTAVNAVNGVAIFSNLSIQSASTGYTLTDRKSTRLNSSHLVISYAVFCLKKKKT